MEDVTSGTLPAWTTPAEVLVGIATMPAPAATTTRSAFVVSETVSMSPLTRKRRLIMNASTLAFGSPEQAKAAAILGGKAKAKAARARAIGLPNIPKLRKQLSVLTTRKLDGRTALGNALREFRQDLIADLGGPSEVTRAQEEVIEVCARTKVLLDSIDDFLFQQKSIINKSKRQLIPIALQRQIYADSLVKNLEKLGLQRKVKPMQDLTSYLQSKSSVEK